MVSFGFVGESTKPTKSDNALGEKRQGVGRGRPSKTSRKQTLTPQEMMQDPEDESQDDQEENKHIKGEGKRRNL